MAIVTASALDDEHKGFGFAAIWSMFLITFLAVLGQYVLGGAARGCVGSAKSSYSTPLMTGFWLGTSFMLAIAFFVLGCVFAAFENQSIKTLGAFYLIQFFFLLGFSVYGLRKREYVYSDEGRPPGIPANSPFNSGGDPYEAHGTRPTTSPIPPERGAMRVSNEAPVPRAFFRDETTRAYFRLPFGL
eukprot:CAMPEP_0172587112 /NCGR_PEP_ID=MMETSP1068-20121228/6235_1 /TAXON_ID=35684 /ORGANISM="Pseudopedinella elastica, Strain CCMP716" /LENGTH=186 /DNA_ID=CAMNT_0013382031 /DNA_START=224 /DNA_END=785 /DNA_ORIENTATION=+